MKAETHDTIRVSHSARERVKLKLKAALVEVHETMYERPAAVVIYLMFLCSVLPSSYSSHFLGGSIMVRPKPGGAQSEVNIILSSALCATYVLCRTTLVFIKIEINIDYILPT